MEDNALIINTEDGKEIRCTILFTHHSDEFNKDYVVFVDENNVCSAASYSASDNGKGSLEEIKTEAEWALLERLLNQYNEDDTITNSTCDCDGACSGCNGSCGCSEEEE